MRKAKKVPVKRGRKPGVKIGPYKKRNKPMTLQDYSERILKPSVKQFKKRGINTVTGEDYDSLFAAANAKLNYTPSPPLTLCGQLEDSILLLENRISNAIAKINSLM